MKRVLISLFTFAALWLQAADQRVLLYITVTNGTANGNTLVVNGDTRTATNDISGTLTTTFLSTNVTAQAATNLYRHLAIYKFTGPISVRMTNATTIELMGQVNQAISFSIGGTWASGVLKTSPVVVIGEAVTIPYSGVPDTTKSNWADGLTALLEDHTLANSLSQNSKFAQELVGTNNVQSIANKRISSSVLADGSSLTNVTVKRARIGHANGTNGLEFVGASSGTNVIAPDSVGAPSLYQNSSTQALNTAASYVPAAENILNRSMGDTRYGQLKGSSNNWEGLNTFSNGAWYGGTINSSQVQRAVITDNGSDALQFFYGGSLESQIMQSPNGPYPILVTGGGVTVALDLFGVTPDDLGVILNFKSAVGYFPLLTFRPEDGTNHWSIANLWGADVNIFYGGMISSNGFLYGGSSSNMTHHNTRASNTVFVAGGSNVVEGSWGVVSRTITSIANGNNIAQAFTNACVRLTGSPGADWALCGIVAGWEDQELEVLNDTGFVMTVPHNSGVDSTEANRISTPGSVPVNVPSGGTAKFKYKSTRWRLQSHYPEASVARKDATFTNGSYTNSIGDRSVFLPAGAARTNRLFDVLQSTNAVLTIKDGVGHAAGTNIIVAGQNGQTIDGAATYTISANYGAVTLQGYGTNWAVISKN